MRRLVTLAAFLGLCCLPLIAAPYVETWDASTANWKILSVDRGGAFGGLSWEATYGGYPGVLRVSAGAPAQPKEDIIFADSTSSGGNLAPKNYGAGFYVDFDFYSQTVVPQHLDVYFLGTGGIAWYLDVLSQVSAGTWSHVRAYMGGAGWYNESAAPDSQFAGDLSNVTEIGVRIHYQDGVAQNYGLDNFSVTPEPGTWSILGTVALGLVYSFRDRLRRRKTKKA